jgi:integrase
MIRHKRPKYIHCFQDRHGTERVYFNRPGVKKIALPGPIYSEAFWIAYHKAMAGNPDKQTAGAARTIKGSINDLIARYYESPAFTKRADATKRNYKSVLEPFRIEYGEGPVAEIRPKDIKAILDKVEKRSTSSAYNLRKRLVMIFGLAVELDLIERSPMADVKAVKHETKGYETWAPEDIAKFRAFWKEGTPQRIAMEILLYTGLRRADAVRLGPQHIKDGVIEITAKKTGADLSIPIDAEFRAVLDTIPHKHMVFMSTAYGAARSEFGFTNWIIDAAKEAGLPPHRSPHGLRKAACVQLADNGCDAFEIMAITGHRDIKEVQTYVAAANKRRQAQSATTKRRGGA